MCQLVVFLEARCDVVPGLVVTGGVTGVVVASGGVVTGVVAAEDDGLDDAPLDAEAMGELGDEDALVVLVVAVVAVVDVELVVVVLLTLAASNGSRLRLVGVVRCPDAA